MVGSPRRKGNTDILVGMVLKGAREKGHLTEKIYLYDLNISPCIDCRECKKGDFQCSRDDDMQKIYPKLSGADVLVFGTPLYWYGPTGQMKLLIDRLRPFISSGKLKEKKALVIIPSEEGPEACLHVSGMFKLIFRYLGIKFLGELLVKAYERGEVRDMPRELEKAFNMGNSL